MSDNPYGPLDKAADPEGRAQIFEITANIATLAALITADQITVDPGEWNRLLTFYELCITFDDPSQVPGRDEAIALIAQYREQIGEEVWNRTADALQPVTR